MTNDSMVGPLLRTTNFCHLEESENLLRDRKKFSELTILYEKKGQHRKALEVLKRQATRSDPQMGKVMPIACSRLFRFSVFLHLYLPSASCLVSLSYFDSFTIC